MESKKERRQKLWKSLEMRTYRRDILLCLGCLLVLIPWYILDGGGYVLILCGLALSPFWAVPLYRAVKLFREPEAYTFHRCVLSLPHQGMIRGKMYFTVVLEYPDGKRIVNTNPVFESHGMAGPLMEDYINQTVTVAYNEETEMVAVIG